MVIKKKRPVEEEPKTEDRKPVVKQVVEIVGEEPPNEAPQAEETTAVAAAPSMSEPPSEPMDDARAKEIFEEEERHAEAVAELMKGESAEETVVAAPTFAPHEEKQKETVAELFKRPVSPIMPEIQTEKSKKPNKLLIILAVIFLLLLLAGGIIVVKKKSFISMLSPTPTPTPTMTPTPSPTPQAVKRGDVTVQVLNGGGVPGAGSKMKSLLEDKGWKVSDVSNADAYTYDKTEVDVKNGKEAYLKLMTDDLKDTYSLASTSPTLSSDVSYDVRVIVGKQ